MTRTTWTEMSEGRRKADNQRALDGQQSEQMEPNGQHGRGVHPAASSRISGFCFDPSLASSRVGLPDGSSPWLPAYPASTQRAAAMTSVASIARRPGN